MCVESMAVGKALVSIPAAERIGRATVNENVIGKQERIGKGLFYFPRNSSMSSSTLPIPAIPKLSTNTLATFGDKNAGNVGPK